MEQIDRAVDAHPVRRKGEGLHERGEAGRGSEVHPLYKKTPNVRSGDTLRTQMVARTETKRTLRFLDEGRVRGILEI
jgi:hypothetical protein